MKTVLVVDDELDIAEAVQAILEEEHFRVILCGNGREALEKLTELKPALAIIDVMMPVMNGYETIDAIRKDPRHVFPILVMSAIQPPREKSAQQGWAGFLKKPFSLEALLESVTRLTSS
ncbi:response regulator [Corallococcus praedator]|uniref:Response regulator n=1 Tax=Corallococcus praedator TaxID=2316724 RepID=A0ABX9QPB5_9BACT|nr:MULTISPECIES: response regulator [Corallococcus]RKH13212.1 response regulator [Corallococcus sp. CA047B]RKH28038.1 response regulator [Corallococcus sp. CA031C]RKI13008.1 response regulator [Corallococcus praedator]